MNTNTNETTRTTADELREIVHDFASDLERIAAGELFWDDNRETTVDATFTDENGEVVEREQVGIFDYFEKHALSIENWKIDRDGECIGGRVLVCFGGPNVSVYEWGVRGSWGCDHAEVEFSSGARDVVIDYLRETMPAR